MIVVYRWGDYLVGQPLQDQANMAVVEDHNLWFQALQTLPSEQKENLPLELAEVRNFSGQELLGAVECSQKLASTQSRTISTPRGPVVIKEKLDKIAVWVRRFIAVGDAAVQYDPGHAAIPWAVFRLVRQVSASIYAQCYLSETGPLA